MALQPKIWSGIMRVKQLGFYHHKQSTVMKCTRPEHFPGQDRGGCALGTAYRFIRGSLLQNRLQKGTPCQSLSYHADDPLDVEVEFAQSTNDGGCPCRGAR